MRSAKNLDRRAFLGMGLGASALSSTVLACEPPKEPSRIRVGVIGCGSVSGVYLPHLSESPHVTLVSVCDIKPDRAETRGKKFGIANRYPNIDAMLAGEPFDLLVNLTDMQEHEHLNRKAIAAGKHIWSEKPLANSYEAGAALLEQAKARGVRLWGAPTVVNSPQFAFMAKTLASGKMGRLAAARADYGHTGPGWSAFFYRKGGGSLPDLGVYNLTTLTGLLGPALAVTAMTSVVTPTREVDDKGKIQVEAEDNAMVLMDHGKGIISQVQCGFNYFNPHGHGAGEQQMHTIGLVGTTGSMGLVGYDWGPVAVDLATEAHPSYSRQAEGPGDYLWQQGASLAARCLATGEETLFTPEHALHVLEVIGAARQSQELGRRIPIRSTFRWPVVS